MQPFLVSVAEILGEHGASRHVEGDVDLGSFSVGEEPYEGIKPAHVAVDLTNTGSGIVAIGDISGEIKAQCARCLCDFPLLVTGDVEGFYVEERYAEEIPEETDAERISPESKIDLAPALMSAITVEIPFAPLHDPECEGLCPDCGADLNEGRCECSEKRSADHPFAALGALLPTDDSGHESAGQDGDETESGA